MTETETYTRETAKELGADCDNCPLSRMGKFVPSVGPAKADIAFVGEGPGIQEAREGEPFIGPSGRLLTLVNNQFGINRDEVFLTNAALCRPIDGSTPPKSAIAACRPRLLNELEARRSSTVVALGNSAALALLGIEGVTKLRVGPGKRSPYDQLEGMRIIPTVHPAACLRQSDMFPSLVADVRKIVSKPPEWQEPEIRVIDAADEAVEFLKELKAFAENPFVEEWHRRVVIDIEVDIDKETSFDHPNRYGLLCVGFAYEKGKAVVIGEEACTEESVMDAMSEALQKAYLVGQNGKFDLGGMNPHLGSLSLNFDTMIANYVQDERPGIHGLKAQAVETLGAPQYDEEIRRYVGPRDGYGVIPRDVLYKYNGFDVACTYDLSEVHARRMDALRANEERTWPYHDRELPVRGVRDVHDFLVEASNELMFLELNGIAVDKKYALEVSEEYTKSLGSIEDKINEVLVQAGWQVINPRSPQQVKATLKFFGVGTETTNEETLRLILEKLDQFKFNKTGDITDDPYEGLSTKQAYLYQFVENLLVHRRESKLHSTYVKGVLKRLYRGRVYPTFLVHGTTTGRLSCRNPNLQNIPRESSIRKLYVPAKPENVFVQADYSQAELRVLTWLAKDDYFRSILNDPERDLFDELTPVLYPELPSKAEVVPELWKEIRIRVKAFVYGLGYGRTEFSIAKEYKLSVKEAEAVKNRFFSAIPSIVDWQKEVKKHVWEGKDLITPFGRHRRFHLITEDNWKSIQNEAMAFLPQSTSSDICLRAMVRTRRDLRGSGAFVRNIVHDSILVDCPRDMANDVSELLNRRMVESAQEVVGDYVNFATDVHIGSHWGEV